MLFPPGVRLWFCPARRQALALFAAAALIGSSIAGCGAEAWPRGVRGVGDPRFLAHEQAIATIDLLPVDLQVWTEPGHARDAVAVAGDIEGTLASVVATQLAARGYELAAWIDRDGRYVASDGVTRDAMQPDDVARTGYSLSGYGMAQSRVDQQLLAPFLPARLGQATGSDATLYIGGWAFAGKGKGSGKAAKVIGTILIVGIIAIVLVAALAGKDSGAGRAAGKVADGAGRVATGAVKVVGRVALGVARTAGQVGHAIARDPELLHFTIDTMELLAQAGTHVEVYPARPDYYAEGPRRGRSALLLEMTLIDNHTGRTLWHGRQRFPASPERPAQVERAVVQLMSTLPAR